MEAIHQLFRIVKQKTFLEEYTEISSSGGIQHRLAGIGTHKTHQKKELRPEDKTAIKAGITKLVTYLINISNQIPDEH